MFDKKRRFVPQFVVWKENLMPTEANEEIIYGKNAVTEALKAEKSIDTVFMLKNAQGMGKIIALAKQQGVVIKDIGVESNTASRTEHRKEMMSAVNKKRSNSPIIM